MNTLHAIYASTSGNVEFVVESVTADWKKWEVDSKLHRAEVTPLSVFEQNDLFLLATSTWEHGVINPHFARLQRELSQLDCSQKKAVCIGCGDHRYEPVLFCEGMKSLQKTFETQGGQTLGKPLLINGSPYDQYEEHIAPWAQQQYEVLRQYV